MHSYKRKTAEKTPIDEKLLETVMDQTKRKYILQSRSKAIEDA